MWTHHFCSGESHQASLHAMREEIHLAAQLRPSRLTALRTRLATLFRVPAFRSSATKHGEAPAGLPAPATSAGRR